MASDPLCRALTPSEQQWLPQSSLIALAGVLSAESTLDVAGLRAAAQRVAAGQPYLQIRIDAENVCYARNDGVPVTGEILADDDADDDADDTRAALRAAVARQLDARTRVHAAR